MRRPGPCRQHAVREAPVDQRHQRLEGDPGMQPHAAVRKVDRVRVEVRPVRHLARDVDAGNGWDRTLLYCPDPEGECPFTKAKAEGEGIPIVTVDDARPNAEAVVMPVAVVVFEYVSDTDTVGRE